MIPDVDFVQYHYTGPIVPRIGSTTAFSKFAAHAASTIQTTSQAAQRHRHQLRMNELGVLCLCEGEPWALKNDRLSAPPLDSDLKETEVPRLYSRPPRR